MNARDRRHSRLLAAIALVVVAAGAYLIFELGRHQAGYSVLDARRTISGLERELAARAARVDELERRQAMLETSHEIDRETYARVEQELERMQQRIQVEEELAFYRGIVTPEDGASGLRIQSLELSPAGAERHLRLRLILAQAIARNERVSGRVDVSVAGGLDGEPAELAYADLSAGAERAPLDYEFRYFQTIERELALPAGFEPDTVTVEIHPEEPDGDTVTQQFDWEAVGG